MITLEKSETYLPGYPTSSVPREIQGICIYHLGHISQRVQDRRENSKIPQSASPPRISSTLEPNMWYTCPLVTGSLFIQMRFC